MQIWIRIHNFDYFSVVLQYFDAKEWHFGLKKQDFKTPLLGLKTSEIAFPRTWISKFSGGGCPRTPRTGDRLWRSKIEPPYLKSWIRPRQAHALLTTQISDKTWKLSTERGMPGTSIFGSRQITFPHCHLCLCQQVTHVLCCIWLLFISETTM